MFTNVGGLGTEGLTTTIWDHGEASRAQGSLVGTLLNPMHCWRSGVGMEQVRRLESSRKEKESGAYKDRKPPSC